MSTDFVEMERQRCAAFDAFDLDALRPLLSDNYIHVHGNGIFDQSRDEYFVTLATRTPGRYQTERSDLVVHDYGDFAIQSGTFHAQMWPEDGSDRRVVDAVATGVWRRVEERWELASFQVTKTV